LSDSFPKSVDGPDGSGAQMGLELYKGHLDRIDRRSRLRTRVGGLRIHWLGENCLARDSHNVVKGTIWVLSVKTAETEQCRFLVCARPRACVTYFAPATQSMRRSFCGPTKRLRSFAAWVSPYVKTILPNVVGLRVRIAVQQSEIGLYPPGENCCRKSIRRWEFVTRP
jgi:hypothetical protein